MNNSIGIVIPCYLGGEITLKLISEILTYADKIVLIDDKCPLKTGKKILEKRAGEISISNITKGCYIAKITHENGVKIEKLIIKII